MGLPEALHKLGLTDAPAAQQHPGSSIDTEGAANSEAPAVQQHADSSNLEDVVNTDDVISARAAVLHPRLSQHSRTLSSQRLDEQSCQHLDMIQQPDMLSNQQQSTICRSKTHGLQQAGAQNIQQSVPQDTLQPHNRVVQLFSNQSAKEGDQQLEDKDSQRGAVLSIEQPQLAARTAKVRTEQGTEQAQDISLCLQSSRGHQQRCRSKHDTSVTKHSNENQPNENMQHVDQPQGLNCPLREPLQDLQASTVQRIDQQHPAVKQDAAVDRCWQQLPRSQADVTATAAELPEQAMLEQQIPAHAEQQDLSSAKQLADTESQRLTTDRAEPTSELEQNDGAVGPAQQLEAVCSQMAAAALAEQADTQLTSLQQLLKLCGQDVSCSLLCNGLYVHVWSCSAQSIVSFHFHLIAGLRWLCCM